VNAPIGVTGIRALYVHVSDLERSVGFYAETLGLTFNAVEDGVEVATLPDGFRLYLDTPHEGMVVMPGTTELEFATDDLESVVQRARMLGTAIEDEVVHRPEGDGIGLWDPDGYHLVLWQPRSLD
jgi:predicted enzyme related to lactoylglutathione lyase